MSRFERKMNGVMRKLKDYAYLVACVETEGEERTGSCIISTTDEVAEDLVGVLASVMERNEHLNNVILGAALSHLKRYEVDCKNFIHELYETE